MKNLLILCLLTLNLTLLGSCSLSSAAAAEESICISLPVWPPQDSLKEDYPQLSRWHIVVSSAKEEVSFYTCESTVVIQTKKNRPFCLLAQPVTLLFDNNECAYFKPAGFLYPAENKLTSAACATWEQGFLANIMKTLFSEGRAEALSPVEIEYLVSIFNWKKAEESIEKKISQSDKLFYNPWLLNPGPLLEGISSQSFKSTLLNATSCTGLEAANLPEISYLSSFIPENNFFATKNQFTIQKNSPLLLGDGKKMGIFITFKSSKNISLEFIYLPIYIEDI